MAQSAPHTALEHKLEAPKPAIPTRMARATPKSNPSRAIRRITSIVRSRQLSGSLEGSWQGLVHMSDAFCNEPSIDRKGGGSGDQKAQEETPPKERRAKGRAHRPRD